MAKIKNNIAKQFQELLDNYKYVLQEITDNMKINGYNKKDILTFIEELDIKSNVEQLQNDFEYANSLHESVVQDTFTQGYMEDARGNFEHKKTYIYEQLAQKVAAKEIENQR